MSVNVLFLVTLRVRSSDDSWNWQHCFKIHKVCSFHSAASRSATPNRRRPLSSQRSSGNWHLLISSSTLCRQPFTGRPRRRLPCTSCIISIRRPLMSFRDKFWRILRPCSDWKSKHYGEKTMTRKKNTLGERESKNRRGVPPGIFRAHLSV